MFLTLLLVTFVLAVATSGLVARVFTRPIDQILARIIADDISSAWRKYITFAIYVTGISSGVRIWDLEKYITPRELPRMADGVEGAARIVELTTERWVLEVYRTIIGALQGMAWMLLVFFIFALIAYVVVRLGERRGGAAG